MNAEREIRAETTIDASPERVWAVLTDLSRMPEWSPETVRMIPLKPGGLRLGQWYLGLNRRGTVMWPTRNVVTTYEPARKLAWDTRTSGARWVFELAPADGGTRLTERREVIGLTPVTYAFGPLLGGLDAHAEELEDGIVRTLAAIKTAVEGSLQQR